MNIGDAFTKELECIRCHMPHQVAEDDDLAECIRCGDELIRVEQIEQFRKDMMDGVNDND